MKKTLALFLALTMAFGLLLVPVAAGNGDAPENGFRWLETEWAQNENGDRYVHPVDDAGDEDIYNEVIRLPGEAICIQLVVNNNTLDSTDGLSFEGGGIDVYFGFDETFRTYATVYFNSNNDEAKIYYNDGENRIELVRLVSHLDSGIRWIDWHWEHGENGERHLCLERFSDNVGRNATSHKGDFNVLGLFFLDEPISRGDMSNLSYRPDDEDDEGISVEFAYDADFGAYAVVQFLEWDSHGWIIYKDGEVEHQLAELYCGAWEIDAYENLNDKYPVTEWQYDDEDSTLFLRSNSPEWARIVRNEHENARIDYDSGRLGDDHDIVDISYGEDDTYGTFIMVTLRDTPKQNGRLMFDYEIRYGGEGDGGWSERRNYEVYVANHAPRLVLMEGRWDDYGNPNPDEVTDGLGYSISPERLGSQGVYFALVFFEGYNASGEEIYSACLRPEQLSWRRVDGETEDGLDVLWDRDMLCLVPWEYGEYELSYAKGNGVTYTQTVSFCACPTLRFRNANAQPGATVTVPVTLESEDLVCASLGLTLRFDGNSLEFVSCESDVLDMKRVAIGKFDDHVNFAWSVEENETFRGGTELMKLTFRVKEGGGSSRVFVEGLERDADSWNSCYDENGEVVRFERNDFDIRVDEHIAGDLDLDGSVTTEDALCLLRWLVGYENHGIAEEMMEHLCVSGRRQVSLYDVTLLLQYIAGWDVELCY